MRKEDLLLYAITDRAWLGEETLYHQVEKALKGGATMIQIREKELAEKDFRVEAIEIHALCKKYQVPLVINDNVALAKEIDAEGVHVGQSDMEAGSVRAILGPDKIIGVTAKTIEQAQFAEKNGADYLGVGAVFHTGTKSNAKEITHEQLEEICASVAIPAVAIGGITRENVEQLAGRGMNGVAVVSAIFAQPDIEAATRELKDRVSKMVKGKRTMRTALTIAGSDSSGGAGIQADIKTMMANGVYAMSAITALTAQNTVGVTDIMEVEPTFLGEQIDAVFTDIRPDAVKIGMVSSRGSIEMIAAKLREYNAENIVIDPVMVATSGAKLMSEDAIEVLKKELFPLATLLTPNIPEAEVLSGCQITTAEEMIEAARKISQTYHCAVLCKGGHQRNGANDLLYWEGSYRWFLEKRINNPNTHGTGCTLSSAIASNLAKGKGLESAVEDAKAYISGVLKAMLDLGAGNGPMNHGFAMPEFQN